MALDRFPRRRASRLVGALALALALLGPVAPVAAGPPIHTSTTGWQLLCDLLPLLDGAGADVGTASLNADTLDGQPIVSAARWAPGDDPRDPEVPPAHTWSGGEFVVEGGRITGSIAADDGVPSGTVVFDGDVGGRLASDTTAGVAQDGNVRRRFSRTVEVFDVASGSVRFPDGATGSLAACEVERVTHRDWATDPAAYVRRDAPSTGISCLTPQEDGTWLGFALSTMDGALLVDMAVFEDLASDADLIGFGSATLGKGQKAVPLDATLELIAFVPPGEGEPGDPPGEPQPVPAGEATVTGSVSTVGHELRTVWVDGVRFRNRVTLLRMDATIDLPDGHDDLAVRDCDGETGFGSVFVPPAGRSR